MSTRKPLPSPLYQVPPELTAALCVRRSNTLRRIMRQSGMPAEVLIDLALEMLDIASRKLSPSPIQRQAVGLGAARWRNVSPEVRSETLRKAAQARWAKHKKRGPGETDKK
jgi:hypothetical protein